VINVDAHVGDDVGGEIGPSFSTRVRD
jgi:hypothetical protein